MSLPTGPFHTFTIPGEEITWAGECPWTARYCFGTASGKIVFQVPDEADELESTTEFQVSDLPVNEVAFWKDLIGIATLGAVLIYRGPLQERELTRIAGWPGRARGMIATPRGLMLAAMGSEGLFCFDGVDAAGDQGWLEHPSESVAIIIRSFTWASGTAMRSSLARRDPTVWREFSSSRRRQAAWSVWPRRLPI